MTTLKHPIIVKVALCLLASLTVMAGLVVTVSIPQIYTVFKPLPYSDILVKLLLTAPAISVAIIAPLSGFFIDRFGRLRLLKIGLWGYTILGTMGFFTTNLYLLLIERIIFGGFVGIVMTITITLINDYFEGKERLKMLGWQSSCISLGAMTFIFLGGVLTKIDWHYPFLLYLLVLLYIPIVHLYFTEPISPKKTDQDLERFDFWHFLPIYIVGAIMMGIFYILPIAMPSFLINYYGFSVLQATLYICISMGVSFVFTSVFHRLKPYLSFFIIYLGTLLALGIGLYAISAIHIDMANATLYILITMIGLGFGGAAVVMLNTNAWLSTMTNANNKGRATGFLTSFYNIGQFASPILFSPFLRFDDLRNGFKSIGEIIFIAAFIVIICKIGIIVKNKSKKINQ